MKIKEMYFLIISKLSTYFQILSREIQILNATRFY